MKIWLDKPDYSLSQTNFHAPKKSGLSVTQLYKGNGADIIDYLGCIEAKWPLPVWNKMHETNALLLFLSTTQHHNKVSKSLGTSTTDLMIKSLDTSHFEHASQCWKVVCYTTQTRRASAVTVTPRRDWEDCSTCDTSVFLFYYLYVWFH